MRCCPSEIGVFNPAPDPSSHALGAVCALCIKVSSVYTTSLPSSLYASISRTYSKIAKL
jgi:hypothetical protein